MGSYNFAKAAQGGRFSFFKVAYVRCYSKSPAHLNSFELGSRSELVRPETNLSLLRRQLQIFRKKKRNEENMSQVALREYEYKW